MATRLMIVDDAPENREAFEEVLCAYIDDIEIVSAAGGAEALAQAPDADLDLILLDVHMPRMDGFDVCRRLKADAATRHIPVLMVSAFMTDGHHRATGLDCGADGYLCKPFDIHELVAQVRALIRIRRNEARLREHQRGLEESERRHRVIAENSYELIAELDSAGRYVYANAQHAVILGYETETLLGTAVAVRVHPEDRARVASLIKRCAGDALATANLTMRYADAQGTWRLLESALRSYDTAAGRRLVLTCRDASERIRILDDLARSRESFHCIVDRGADGILVVTDDAIVRYANEAAGTLLGHTADRLIGSLFEHDLAVSPRVLERRCDKGAVRHIEMHISSTNWNGAPARLVQLHDITNHRQTENALVQAQKLESVGILAGGIAHDFNNILTGIIGNISFAKMEMEERGTVYEAIGDAEKSALRAKALTQQLLTLSKGGAPVRRTASVAALIEDATSFVLTGSACSCRYVITEDLWPADVDAGQISQVIENLVINASQAMPRGGTIVIEAANAMLEADDVALMPSTHVGRYLRIMIKDQGCGIPEDHLSRIFDPYFTTKRQGSGLGLATAYSIVRKHEGHMTVLSEVGKGSTFVVYLPASDGRVTEAAAEAQKPIRGTGAILVMDDESVVRGVLNKALAGLGYEPTCVADGTEALLVYRKAFEAGNPFAAVILDLTVPGGMGGEATIAELLAFDPNVRAIVSSGYSTGSALNEPEALGFKGVVAKPYNMYELSRVLHQVLAPDDAA